MQKSKTVLILGIAVVALLTVLYFTNKYLGNPENGLKLYKKEKEQYSKQIDSIQKVAEKYLQQIDSIGQIKNELEKDYDRIEKQLRYYRKNRYYPDATFKSESERIAKSRYRFDKQDSTTAQE